MMLPKEIRQKSSELFPNDLEKQKIFCMGAAFSLGKDLSDFEAEEQQAEVVEEVKPQEEIYICQEALDMWLAYKKEKHQTYKPRGLEALKKKLLQLSNWTRNTQRSSLSTQWETTMPGYSLPKTIA